MTKKEKSMEEQLNEDKALEAQEAEALAQEQAEKEKAQQLAECYVPFPFCGDLPCVLHLL